MDPVIVIFGFGIGMLIGMTGMGGGSLMTPLLILLFGVGHLTMQYFDPAGLELEIGG